jgi:hypothetical protein
MRDNSFLHYLSPKTVAAMFKDVAKELELNGFIEPLVSLHIAIMAWVTGHDRWYKDAFAKALDDDTD